MRVARIRHAVAMVILAFTGLMAGVSAAEAPPASSPPEPVQANSPPPAEAFARLPFVEDPEISPNGQRIAGFFAANGRQIITIRNLFNDTEKPVLLGIPPATQRVSLAWVNDDNIIVTLRALDAVAATTGPFYVYRAIAVNRISGKVTKLLWDSGGQNAADIVHMPADGGNEVMISAQYSIYSNFEEFWPTVYAVDITNGRKRMVTKGRSDVMDWFADSAGTVRMGIRTIQGGRQSSLIYRPEGAGGSFRVIDRASTTARESLISPFLFLSGTDNALVLHDDAAGRTGIYEVDLTSGKDLRTVQAPDGEAEVAQVFTSADGSTLLGAGMSGTNGRLIWFDAELATLQAQFDKAVGDRRARILSFNRDRTRMLVEVARADRPGSLYFFDIDDGKLRRIADYNDALARAPLSPVRTVRYKARDGLEIEAILTVPHGADPHNLPIVMMPHGGPWGHDTLDYDYLAQFVASRGYVVMQPNFRGSTGYGTEFLRRGEGQLGLAMQDDISDGLKWAVSQGIADPLRACIVGASYGGYAAMWGIAKDPELYRCAIAISGVANLRREVNDFGSYLFSKKFREDWERMTPDFAAVSPINAVARIKAPLLLIHGKKDVTVDHGQSSSMNSRMKEAGKQVDFVSLPEADHYFTREADRIVLLKAIEGFLAKYDPAGPGAAAKP